MVCIVLLSFFLSGCSRGKNLPVDGDNADSAGKGADSAQRTALLVKDQEWVVVYFAAPGGKNLVPVTLSINPTKEAAKVAVEKLLAGPENDFSLPTVVEGTKLKDLYLQGSTAYVDLTEEVLETPEDKAEETINAIVFTLTEFSTVEDVQIMINSQVNQEIGGVNISEPIKRPSVINYYGEKPPGQDTVKVYFSDENAMYLVPITVQGDAKNLPLSALKQLIAGPPEDSGLMPTVWKGTAINHFKVEEDIAVVDFTAQVLGYGGGSTAESMLVSSVLLTLTQFPEIEGVQFLIEGKKLEYLPEGTEVSSPLSAPRNFNFSQ